jgi:hypothetical protein
VEPVSLRIQTVPHPVPPAVLRAPGADRRWYGTPALAAFGIAVLLAFGVDFVNTSLVGSPEARVMRAGVLALMAVPLAATVFLLWWRERPTVESVACSVLFAAMVVLLGLDLYWMWGQVRVPADILIWSESEFVNDIIKLRTGYPLFSAQANNESFNYNPGSQALTWLIARLLGQGGSIPFYRAIQVGYTFLATVLALLSARRLMRLAGVDLRRRGAAWASAIGLPALFLVATNPQSNPFAQDLHNDALALLVCALGFWLLLVYVERRDLRVLAAITLIPAIGFSVKQSLLIWGPIYFLFLVAFDVPRSWKRAVAFGAGSAAVVGGLLLAANALWGEDYWYWTMTVLGSHGVSPLRAVSHAIDLWIYWAFGVSAGLILLRGPRARMLIGPYLVWLFLLGTETYTSGIAWMLNHTGPGCLLAACWFLAAMARLGADLPLTTPRFERVVRAVGAAGLALLVLGGLGLARVPLPSVSPDVERYVSQIEAEFAGEPVDRVLLDAGSWIYARSDVVMKDRASNIGERGYSRTADFSGILGRIRRHEYRKILLRDYHEGDLWYDHEIWSVSSGIRAALNENYREVRTIPAVRSSVPGEPVRYLFHAVSVLEPRSSGGE